MSGAEVKHRRLIRCIVLLLMVIAVLFAYIFTRPRHQTVIARVDLAGNVHLSLKKGDIITYRTSDSLSPYTYTYQSSPNGVPPTTPICGDKVQVDVTSQEKPCVQSGLSFNIYSSIPPKDARRNGATILASPVGKCNHCLSEEAGDVSELTKRLITDESTYGAGIPIPISCTAAGKASAPTNANVSLARAAEDGDPYFQWQGGDQDQNFTIGNITIAGLCNNGANPSIMSPKAAQCNMATPPSLPATTQYNVTCGGNSQGPYKIIFVP